MQTYSVEDMVIRGVGAERRSLQTAAVVNALVCTGYT